MFGDPNWNNVLQVANSNEDYVALGRRVMEGFPKKKPMVSGKIKDYWIVINELSKFKGFVLVNHRRTIKSLDVSKNILKHLHAAHQGIVRIKQRARNAFLWPRIDLDIWNIVGSYEACQTRLPSQTQGEMVERVQPFVLFKWLL